MALRVDAGRRCSLQFRVRVRVYCQLLCFLYPLPCWNVKFVVYPMYRSYGTLKSCEREQSGTSTVGRCGTQGGPPGRMILAQ